MHTCKVCSFQYPDDQPKCPRCGFGSTGPSLAAPPAKAPDKQMQHMINLVPGVSVSSDPQADTPTVSIGGMTIGGGGESGGLSGMRAMGIPAAPKRRAGAIIVGLVLLALPIVGILFASQVIDKVSDAIPDVDEIVGEDGIFGPPGGNNVPAVVEEETITPKECKAIFKRYLKRMFFVLGNDPDELSRLFIEVSQKLGPGSEEYRELVDIFSSHELASHAALGRPAKAFKGAKKLIEKECRD